MPYDLKRFIEGHVALRHTILADTFGAARRMMARFVETFGGLAHSSPAARLLRAMFQVGKRRRRFDLYSHHLSPFSPIQPASKRRTGRSIVDDLAEPYRGRFPTTTMASSDGSLLTSSAVIRRRPCSSREWL